MSRVPLRRDRHYSVAGESSHDGVPSDRLFTPRETCYRHEYARIQRTRPNHEPIYIYVYIVSTGPVHRYVYTNREQLKREIHQQIVDPRESWARNQPTVVDRLPSTSRASFARTHLFLYFLVRREKSSGNSFAAFLRFGTSTELTFASSSNRQRWRGVWFVL